MEIEKGKIINDAYEILEKTYKEINRLKDDFADLITDYVPTMKYIEEYSYVSAKALHLRANHTYLFKREIEEPQSEILKEEHAVVILCLFTDRENLNRINLKDQPELWIGSLNIKRAESTRPWDYWDCIKLERRKCFKNRELKIGGEVFEYHWINETGDEENKEEWEGKFIGYPLADISSREEIKEKIMDKLFESLSDNNV